MQKTWNKFVYYLIEDKKKDVEEKEYQNTIESQLQLLDWEKFSEEILSKQSYEQEMIDLDREQFGMSSLGSFEGMVEDLLIMMLNY